MEQPQYSSKAAEEERNRAIVKYTVTLDRALLLLMQPASPERNVESMAVNSEHGTKILDSVQGLLDQHSQRWSATAYLKSLVKPLGWQHVDWHLAQQTTIVVRSNIGPWTLRSRMNFPTKFGKRLDDRCVKIVTPKEDGIISQHLHGKCLVDDLALPQQKLYTIHYFGRMKCIGK
eukprot:gnl/MRDRNA2_/MRDRNA2_362377_c0_seq1.p1 gnl/MRDRNA2_/MRDRNA2_362377_c0~~gnl/MRDRNA2_/MRDRNA2_362377_c0_seq1.p1  ORF type:complete len:175 (+),score=27.77 gnl/MRDRNA2_/MRDRNA2_362377_c0_seq1:91-615(+)